MFAGVSRYRSRLPTLAQPTLRRSLLGQQAIRLGNVGAVSYIALKETFNPFLEERGHDIPWWHLTIERGI